MATSTPPPLPTADHPDRAAAKQTVWRLAAAALGHPTPELHDTLTRGAFHNAFDAAWRTVTGRAWPRPAPPAGYAAFEAGYITTFVHGPGGKPAAPLLASAYDELLAGQGRPAYMLNVAAFYRHFGLRAATGDEGLTDEPDHLAAELEFMAVLTHLEARALGTGRDPDAPRRAQRDFLRRYLRPLLAAVGARLRAGDAALDPTLRQLIDELAAWAEAEAATLEARVGRHPGQGAGIDGVTGGTSGPREIDQRLWD